MTTFSWLQLDIAWISLSNSSIDVFHFSKLILFIAHFSFLGLQKALWTTAVAPTPKQNKKQNTKLIFLKKKKTSLQKQLLIILYYSLVNIDKCCIIFCATVSRYLIILVELTTEYTTDKILHKISQRDIPTYIPSIILKIEDICLRCCKSNIFVYNHAIKINLINTNNKGIKIIN